MTFKVGDQVVLRSDVSQRHAKSVPCHAGYTTAQFAWRNVLHMLSGHVGTITKVFETSKHVNVEFMLDYNNLDGEPVSQKRTLGLDHTELELYDAVSN